MAGHARSSAWVKRTARLEWDQYETRSDAKLVESRLIHTLCPLYNRAESLPRSRKQNLPWPSLSAEQGADIKNTTAYRCSSYLDFRAIYST